MCHDFTKFHMFLRHFWTSHWGFLAPSGTYPLEHLSHSPYCGHHDLSFSNPPWKCPIPEPSCSLQGHHQVHHYHTSSERTQSSEDAGPHRKWKQISWTVHGKKKGSVAWSMWRYYYYSCFDPTNTGLPGLPSAGLLPCDLASLPLHPSSQGVFQASLHLKVHTKPPPDPKREEGTLYPHTTTSTIIMHVHAHLHTQD